MNADDYIGKRYKDGDGYMTVIGLIRDPAIILQDPVTRRQKTVVIDSGIHKAMQEINAEEAAVALEQHLQSKPWPDPKLSDITGDCADTVFMGMADVAMEENPLCAMLIERLQGRMEELVRKFDLDRGTGSERRD